MKLSEILRQLADTISANEEPAQDNQVADIEPADAPKMRVQVNPESGDSNELNDIKRLAGNNKRINTTIADPAGPDTPIDPVFISPLQQQLELQKQQGGKESPIINQIIDNSTLGSTAGEQPEQSVYHDSPLQDNEYVGAGGSVRDAKNATTTQGATKPWYRI